MAFSAELFATTAVRGGVTADPATGAVLTPIYQSTTYHQQAVGVHKGFTYSRAANPTVSALEAALGALEDTPPAVCFATGMAAISALFAMLRAGDHLICSKDVYAGTVRLLDQIVSGYGIAIEYVDTSKYESYEKQEGDFVEPGAELLAEPVPEPELEPEPNNSVKGAAE